MIGRITGTVLEVRGETAIVDVAGVGYVIAIPNAQTLNTEETVVLHTHLAVRENALDLYGFQSREELEMFEHLLTLPKIGPKSALAVMTQADIALLQKAIATEDPTLLSKMSGIGKKTSEKIVSGLKDTFENYEFTTPTSAESGDADVIDALITLGYTQKDARDALAKLPPEHNDTNTRIKEALKLLSS